MGGSRYRRKCRGNSIFRKFMVNVVFIIVNLEAGNIQIYRSEETATDKFFTLIHIYTSMC